MYYIKGSAMQPSKKDAPTHAKHMKGEIRAHNILLESIKDSLIPYVSNWKLQKKYMRKWWSYSLWVLQEKQSL